MIPKRELFPITKTISNWNKALELDFLTVFKLLSKALITFNTGNWGEAVFGTLNAISTIRFKNNPGQLAWILIYRGMIRAIYDLTGQYVYSLSLNKQKNLNSVIKDHINFSFEENKMTIDNSLFENPTGLSIVEDVRIPFEEFLKSFGFNAYMSKNIGSRLPSFFAFSLLDEWMSNRSLYQHIYKAMDTPLTNAIEREIAWLRYRSYLQKEIDIGIFDESFSLRQVYIPLRGYTKIRTTSRHEDYGYGIWDKNILGEVVDIEKELLEWINRTDSADAIRIISGGPGSGKSSIAKIIAARLADKQIIKILYVPLYQIDPSKPLISSIQDFVRESGILPYNPLDRRVSKSRLLIIFDGLDELTESGETTIAVARRFIENIQNMLARQNLKKLLLNVILSGRTVIIQSTKGAYFKADQIISLLPYYISYSERDDYFDPNKLLKVDQRHKWWKLYGEFTGYLYNDMPKDISNNIADELTSQPLLNYLVSISYTRGKLDFKSKKINRNNIYYDLLTAVHERQYAGHPLRPIQILEQKQFIRVLEEIALSVWHGNGRTSTLNEIRQHCDRYDMLSILEAFQEGVEEGIMRILIAFYFRVKKRYNLGDPIFEFTHKTFMEYLVARRIVRELYQNSDSFEHHKKNGNGYSDILVQWTLLCGKTMIDNDLLRFLRDEISLQDFEELENWQKNFSILISYVVKFGVPMHKFEERGEFAEENRLSLNSQLSLIAVLNSCALKTTEVSKISWPTRNSAKSWINKLKDHDTHDENIGILNGCLSYISFNNCNLKLMDFEHADLGNDELDHVNLERTNLNGAILAYASLKKANLKEAHLSGADLMMANLENANLGKSDLNGANLNYSNLRGANFAKAFMKDAKLFKTDLEEANLENADLENAYLSESNLRTANCKSANLKYAELSGSILKSACFDFAELEGANLSSSNLERATMKGANLTAANLSNSNLEEANLKGANLTGANLRGVSLNNVNTQDVDLTFINPDDEGYDQDES